MGASKLCELPQTSSHSNHSIPVSHTLQPMGASTHILTFQPLNLHLPHTLTYGSFNTYPQTPTTQSPSPTHSNLCDLPHTSSHSHHSISISHTLQSVGDPTHILTTTQSPYPTHILKLQPLSLYLPHTPTYGSFNTPQTPSTFNVASPP